RRAIMANDDNGDYQDNISNNDDHNHNDDSSPVKPPDYGGIPIHPLPAVIHPPSGPGS
ncbi:hypothetical protein H5410_025227, partial [Solanum commersonii]